MLPRSQNDNVVGSERMLPIDPDNTSDLPKNRENRRLKIAGLVLMALPSPGFFYLANRLDPDPWQTIQDTSQFVFIALLYVGAANVFALGMIVFLAGFTNLPLLTNRRARKGAWVKLAAANLLIVCFGVIFLEDSQSFKESWEESWIYIVGLVLFLFIARSGVLLLRRGWKYDATPAEKLLERDRRPPVVYIRSFKDDDKIMLGSSRVRRLLTPLAFTAAITPEQELAIIMNRAGPVVAIGRPGEALPELGAARLYVGDDQWRDKITDLMKRARLVVIRGGATANLWWEIDQARMLLPPRKLILVSLGKDKDAKSFEAEVEKKFGRPESSDAPRKKLLLRRLVSLMMPLGNDIGRIIYFGEDSKSYVEPIGFFVPSWKWLFLAPYRPYRESLDSAFRRVFKQLDLPWVDRKNRTTAALLGLFVGWFGFHHFYLGNKRRGMYYLLFWWTLVPLFLAWKDAIQLALTDEQEFERKFVHPPQA